MNKLTKTIITRKCARCKTPKPLSEFHSNKYHRHQAYCRTCSNEYTSDWAKRNRLQLAARIIIQVPTEQKCGRCGTVKPSSDFHFNKTEPSGLARYCKACKKITARDSRLKVLFQITGDEGYQKLLSAQGGACAICEKRPTNRPFHVDHDHVTGEVRGILCKVCNTALGMLGDTAAGIKRALRYLSP